MKRCNLCKQTLPPIQFYRNKSTKDGLASCCKHCHKTRYNDDRITRHDELLKEIRELKSILKEHLRILK